VSLCGGARRFRFAGKKEAAGAAVAVRLVGIMDIECHLVIGAMVFGAAIDAEHVGKQ
jgi:hypothetical protein